MQRLAVHLGVLPVVRGQIGFGPTHLSTLKIVKPGALLEILSSTAVTEAMDDDYEK